MSKWIHAIRLFKVHTHTYLQVVSIIVCTVLPEDLWIKIFSITPLLAVTMPVAIPR